MRNLFSKKEAIKPINIHKVFGSSLIDVCERENQAIPTITEEVLGFLEKNAVELEGIFRIPGNSLVVDQLKAFYDGEESNIHNINECKDKYAVAGLLKLYLRELPDPLLTYRFYSTFIAVQKNRDFNYRMENLRKLVNGLPPCHKNLLIRLCAFIIKVSQYSNKNKMTTQNLAMLFGPNILRPKNESRLAMIEDASHVNGVMLALLEEFDYLVTCTAAKPFKEPNPTPLNSPKSPKKSTKRLLSPRSPRNFEIRYNGDSPKSNTSKRGVFKFNFSELPELLDNEKKIEIVDEITEIIIEEKVSDKDDMLISPKGEPEKREQHEHEKIIINDSSITPKEIKLLFDLDNPLEYINTRLERQARKDNRSQDIKTMTKTELKAEKLALKTLLRTFDFEFKRKYGKEPSKEDKFPLKSAYRRYRDLTNSINEENTIKVETNGKTEIILTDDPNYKKLKQEKRRIQKFLHNYQEEFISKNGRRVQYVQDRKPVQKEYDEYKELKAKIKNLEEEYNKVN